MISLYLHNSFFLCWFFLLNWEEYYTYEGKKELSQMKQRDSQRTDLLFKHTQPRTQNKQQKL